jgi:hypothetical protein
MLPPGSGIGCPDGSAGPAASVSRSVVTADASLLTRTSGRIDHSQRGMAFFGRGRVGGLRRRWASQRKRSQCRCPALRRPQRSCPQQTEGATPAMAVRRSACCLWRPDRPRAGRRCRPSRPARRTLHGSGRSARGLRVPGSAPYRRGRRWRRPGSGTASEACPGQQHPAVALAGNLQFEGRAIGFAHHVGLGGQDARQRDAPATPRQAA